MKVGQIIGLGLVGYVVWSALQPKGARASKKAAAKKKRKSVTAKPNPNGINPALLYRPANQTPADWNRLSDKEKLQIIEQQQRSAM